MFKNAAVVFACFLMLNAFSVFAQSPDCGPFCKIPDLPVDQKEVVVYDGLQGVQNNFDFSVSRRTTVRAVIKNMNPFLYEYKISLEATPVAEPALGAFLSLLGEFVSGSVEPKKKADDAKPKPPTEELAADVECQPTHLVEQQGELIKKVTSAETKMNDLIKGDKEIQKIYAEQRKRLESSGATCDTLCETGRNLVKLLSDYKVDMEFQKELKQLEAFATVSQASIETYTKLNPSCVANAFIKDFSAYAKIIGERLAPAYMDDFNKIVARKKELDKAKQSITDILSSPSAFHQEIALGPYETPKDITIKVARKLKTEGAKEEAVANVILNFGGRSRFALSGGIAFSLLDKEEFQRVQGVQTVDGAQTVTTLVGFKEQSDSRIVPMLVLNTRLIRINKGVDAFHASLGVSAKNDNKGTDVEYLVGGAFSFAEERFFLSFGGYAGRVQELEGGLIVGDRIPEDFGELPIRKRYKWDFAIALTYKIK